MHREIRSLARTLHCDPSDDAVAKLAAYVDLVQTWNARMNLTAARSPDALVEVLCADALRLAQGELVPAHARVVDVGSGAGAPVLPLLLLRGDLTATLVEPLRKRVAFLRTAIGSLDLAGRAAVIEGRAEPGRPIPGAPFDVAMSRATLAPPAWLALGAGLAPCVLVLTAQESPPPAPSGWTARSVGYTAPGTGAPRRITQYRSCSGEKNA